MTGYLNTNLFKKIILLFWALWWLIACWTDVVGGLAHLGILHASWAPDSNFPGLQQALQMYRAPLWLVTFLFIGIIAWSGLSSAGFFVAGFALIRGKENGLRYVEAAFIISLSLWLAFFLADQIVMKFDLEENHMVQGGFELLTFLFFYLVNKEESLVTRKI